MMIDTPSAPGTLVTLEVAAQLIMVTPRWIQKLAKEGWIPKAERGKYSLIGVVQGYVNYLKDENRRTSKSAADSRVRDARAREIELRVARQQAELIPYSEHVAILDEILGTIRAAMEGAPARITRDLAVREDLRGVIHETLDKASRRLAQVADEHAALGTAVAALRHPDA
jgi:phage terminase Nu1 subunit (DNA packaging protein)